MARRTRASTEDGSAAGAAVLERQWQDRIVGEGHESPSQLLANPNNVKVHPQGQQEAVLAAMRRLGWVQRVIVNKRTGFVVDGHLRVMLAITEDQARIPVLYVDLSDEEEQEILVTFDPLAALAAYDAEALAENTAAVQGRLGGDHPLTWFLNDLVRQHPKPVDPFAGNDEPADTTGGTAGDAAGSGEDPAQDAPVRIVELRFTEEAGDEFLRGAAALIAHTGAAELEDVLLQLVRDAVAAIEPDPVA